MATVDLITTGGGYSNAQPVKLRSADCVTCSGAAIAIGRVAWGGSDSPLDRVPWIPKAGTPLLGPDGRTMNPAWDRALRWLFEEYVGGIRAPTVPSITQSIVQTQTQVIQVAVAATTAQATANSAADAVNTTKQVLINEGVEGADQIPPAQKPGGPSQFEP